MCNTLSHCCKHYYVTIIMTIEVSLHVVKSFIPSFRGAYLIAKQLPLDIIANRHSIHIFHEDRRNWNLIWLFNYDCNSQWLLSEIATASIDFKYLWHELVLASSYTRTTMTYRTAYIMDKPITVPKYIHLQEILTYSFDFNMNSIHCWHTFDYHGRIMMISVT